MQYQSADEWREEAMQRPDGVDTSESDKRRELARNYQMQQDNAPDADVLVDQELYILGKMDIEEYQEYLVFKHSPAT
ncbi:MAG: hypothetical protein R8K22_00730 [Mariprofundaceae bacterium]